MGKPIDLSTEISQTLKTFPRDEMFVLTAQIKRAADSVSLNIAEGSTGQTNPEFRKFLGYALRSAIEVVAAFFSPKREICYRKMF